MRRLGDPGSAREWCGRAAEQGLAVGFVPTMGSLHEGHLALVERAVAENDACVVSVFVNPLQFDDPADFARYPRDFDGDAARLETAGCAMVFTGELAGFFPDELDADGRLPGAAHVDPGPAAVGLEGDFRPGHFEGVATIVDRLFEIVRPTRAYFGRKDYQQVQVVADLVQRRGGPEVVACPTVREGSGLAMSSRNALLSGGARRDAELLSLSLAVLRRTWALGERDRGVLEAVLRSALNPVTGSGEVGIDERGGDPVLRTLGARRAALLPPRTALELDYAVVRDVQRFAEVAPGGPLTAAVALVAARVGGVRLLDNSVLGDGDPVLDRTGADPAGAPGR